MKIYSIKDDTLTVRDTTGNLVVFNLSNKNSSRDIPGVQEQATVDPSTNSQTITPESPNVGFSSVKVNPVTASIDPDIKPENIVYGATILDVDGAAYPVPDFSSLGYNDTEADHAFIAWMEKRSQPYVTVPTILAGLKQDIEDSVAYWNGIGITTSSQFIESPNNCTAVFVMKPALGLVKGAPNVSGDLLGVSFSLSIGDAVYCPALELAIHSEWNDASISASLMSINQGFSNAYFEGYTYKGRKSDGTTVLSDLSLVVEVSSDYSYTPVLFNNFEESFWANMMNNGTNTINLVKGIEIVGPVNGIHLGKVTNASRMFNSTVFRSAFNGNVALDAATRSDYMFENAHFNDVLNIPSITLPSVDNASYMFFEANTSSSANIGTVAAANASNVEQMFRGMSVHIEGPLDISSCTDAENLCTWNEPSNTSAPMITFGPVDQNCYFFYNTAWATSIPSWSTSQIKNVEGFISYPSYVLQSISLIDLSAAETGAFVQNDANLQALTTVAGFTGMKLDINFATALNLSEASVVNILTQAADMSASETHPVLTLHANVYNALTDETKTLASTKGWTIASA